MAGHHAAADQKYGIVTGGSKGIGKETVRGLMETGYHVVIAARNVQVCEAAKKDLESGEKVTGSCECQELDVEDPQSIRRFAEVQIKELQKRNTKLNLLVNNAGVLGVGMSTDGIDRHMLCNHLGPFLLTRLLKDSFATNSRIVNVSSRLHLAGRLEFDRNGDLLQKPKNWLWRYGDSKLANIVFTSELQKRLADKHVVAVSVSPGLVATSIFASVPWPLNHVTSFLSSTLGQTAAQGARCSIYAATSDDVTGSPEQVFHHACKPQAPLAAALDPSVGKQLWDWSEKFVDAWK